MRSERMMGVLVVCLGLWGGLVALLGPTFDFETRGTPKTWVWSQNHVTLSIAPAIAAILAGVLMAIGSRSPLARLGASIAVVSGAWFGIAPALERLWSPHSLGVAGSIGARGSTLVRGLESIGYFYGTGAALVLIGATALGMLAVMPAPARHAARVVRGREPEPADTRMHRPSHA